MIAKPGGTRGQAVKEMTCEASPIIPPHVGWSPLAESRPRNARAAWMTRAAPRNTEAWTRIGPRTRRMIASP